MGNCCRFHPYYIDSDLREIRHDDNSFPIDTVVKMGADGEEFYFTTPTANSTATHHFPMGSRKKTQNYVKKVVKLNHMHGPCPGVRPDYTLLGIRATQTKEEKREQRKKVKVLQLRELTVLIYV